MSQSDDRARFTPTATLVTSSGMAVGLCLLAVVASAPRLLVLALPFIVHAVRALVNWYREGKDPCREMIRLTTYLGHRSPAHTR